MSQNSMWDAKRHKFSLEESSLFGESFCHVGATLRNLIITGLFQVTVLQVAGEKHMLIL